MPELRQWQELARIDFHKNNSRDFLVSATPGSGKTHYALTVARDLIQDTAVQRIVAVVPSVALQQQWADEAAEFGLSLMPVRDAADYDKAGYNGCVVNYQQLLGPGGDLLRRATRVPTLAILDEIHHAGTAQAWGTRLQYAVENATYRLALTGTPWRKDRRSPIPFVTYDENGTVHVDSSYEYGEAVAEGVCRRIEFHAYDGSARWVDCGRVVSADLGENLTEEDTGAVLDTVLMPSHSWIPTLLAEAVSALNEIRESVPDAGGLVIAERQDTAKEYAEILKKITGEMPVVAISKEPCAKDSIDEFKSGKQRWLVAVKMVSEGVDIPRLTVGVYANKTTTPLFFRQVVGRFVRVRPNEEINSRLFIPAVPVLMEHAREIELELRHQLERETDRYEKDRSNPNRQPALDFREPLSTSEAIFDRILYGGLEATQDLRARAEEWCRARGIPTMYALNILRDIISESIPTQVTATDLDVTTEPKHRRETLLRGDINTLTGKVAYRSGMDKGEVNARILRNFPKRKDCTIAELEELRAYLARWLESST